MLSISFDIDGVLLYTKDIVRQAYAEAGVVITDEHWSTVWGKSWTEWLPEFVGDDIKADEIHQIKNALYMGMLQDLQVPKTSPCLLAHELLRSYSYDVTFITGSSHPAARAVINKLGLPLDQLTCTGLTRSEKIRYVVNRHIKHIHVDDDAALCKTLGTTGIYYHDQSYRELREEVFGAWTQLS